jgi:hypothetical protein
MLLGLLVYAYCRGIRSSRQIERLCLTDVALRVLCAQDAPDHCTIARFRVERQDAFTTLFTQILMIAGLASLGQFGTVAIDGTKLQRTLRSTRTAVMTGCANRSTACSLMPNAPTQLRTCTPEGPRYMKATAFRLR